MADQAIDPADPAARSSLDQAAADGSITRARTRAVDPVPIVVDGGSGSATLEPVLETNEPDMGVNGTMTPDAQATDGSTAAAPLAGSRRRLSPRPVPVSRRRRAQAATDEERTPAEEMDDVGTQDDKGESARTAGSTPDVSPQAGQEAGASGMTTATKTVRPKTAAEIVAEQRAREQAAAKPADQPGADEAGAERTGSEQADAAVSEDAAAGNDAPNANPAAAAAGTGAASAVAAKKPSGASGNKPPTGKGGSSGSSGSGRGKQALTSVGSGVRKLRNLIASLIWLIAVLAAAVLALGALFTALDQTNQSNEIVRWILERGHDLVGPFKDLFRLETAKNTLLVNWGIAALVYLIAGKIVEKIIRP
ncbi:hypothetical protein [Kribbella sp. NPDC048928]|uniref:hypothetical protein n=1 Tax=Kribbella sp. NPDC048928 TaxID=3364111 RepID=UPI0037167463